MPLHPDLVDYRQDIKLLHGNSYNEHEFVGLPPILVRANERHNVLTQTGYAVGWNKIVRAPDPLFPSQLLERKDVQTIQLDDLQWKTSWSYIMAVDSSYDPNYAVLMAWPTAPTLFDAP
jgi:hypothetical protein